MRPLTPDKNHTSSTTRQRRRVVLGLQTRLTVLIVGLTFSVAWLACAYLVRSSTRMVRQEQSEHAIQVASMLARIVAPLMAEGDQERLAVVVDTVTRGSPLIHASLYDAAWSELALVQTSGWQEEEWPGDVSGDDPPLVGQPRYHPATKNHPAFLEVVYPVSTLAEGILGVGYRGRPRLLGYVRAGITVQSSLDWTARTVDILTGVGIMIGLLAVPLCFVLARRIVTPLDEVSQSMAAFAHGDLWARCAVRRRDEIGYVATAFNRMADRHEQTHDNLMRLNADLERRVARRTRELRELAARDPLTGLFNRRHFDDVLSRRFAEARRYDSELSCIMVDVDDFKAVNDEFGHQIGDKVLLILTSTIKNQLRATDVAARYGGDEFVILLPQPNSDRALVLCERIASDFAGRVEERLTSTNITLSIGISDAGDPDLTGSTQLLRAADRALYQAKRTGKNRIVTAPTPEPAGRTSS